ncbi:MAG TPA: DUF1801 domain-containing protein [Chitinophagaceae bacterium]|nr:DUF1801 domain-containing protein [Chitinophagaceae bacterium]
MKTIKTELPKNVDEYIAAQPKDVQTNLNKLRTTIKSVAPDAEEVISYQMPGYRQNGMVVFFAGYKNHIGFYPTASGIENFKDEIAKYKWSKGAIQFPLGKPLPLPLIKKIVRFKLKENEAKAALKKSIKK